MSVALAKQSYGKSKVCLSYITRADDRHDFTQMAVDVALEGDFEAAYKDGDNALVVPTDTMKNSVYAIAREHGIGSIEGYSQNLANHFLGSFSHVNQVTIQTQEMIWQRINADGKAHKHAFTGGGSEQNTCEVVASADGISMQSGLLGLQVLKTTDSAFEGFLRDKYTTLKETSDRIFATTITTSWPCRDLEHNWTATRQKIRGLLLDVFANNFSPSVQKTLHEMATAVLADCPEIDEIALNMPNQHHILADLAKLNLENRNDIFVPSPEPFGVISATIRRQS